MIIQKVGLLQRVRTVLTVFVMLIGLGSTLMAMKPAEKNAAFTYGVAITANGTNYLVKANLADETTETWECNQNPAQVCTVTSDISAPVNTLIPKDQASILERGNFQQ